MTAHQEALFGKAASTADISACGRYRYSLTRTWSEGPVVAFVMLNPSTADAVDNDPTIERCQRRARDWGMGGLLVVNLFALRSTDPAALYADPLPVGERNDAAILGAAVSAGLVVCAWGEHGVLKGRSSAVTRLLRSNGVSLSCLKLNASGEPAHPLYLPYSLKPVPFVRSAG